ncbi:MAG: YicC family protein [Lentisphaeria bacterium]|nr:YicC family protein [Lentisphaeria bacterium]
MKSMTGFGSASATDTTTGIGLKAEISSINKKQFELKLGLSRELSMYEIPLRSLVSEKITRGAVTLRIDFLPGVSNERPVDFSKLHAVYNAAKRFQKENNIPGEITISDLLALPDMATAVSADYSDPLYLKLLTEAVTGSLDNLLNMRFHEGEKLKTDLLARIDSMEQTVKQIQPLAAKLPELQKAKLLEKIKDLDIPVEENDERLLKEAVIFADKLDVTEEITRLFCHFNHFRKLADSQNAVGRSLDFLVQEIFRECNTLGTKAASPEISPMIVELKTELEKIREQVQNIE